MLTRLILLLVLGLPFIEIALFIVIGQAIGVLPTLLGIIVTGAIGALVLRWQGMGVIRQMQERLSRRELPARQMGDAVLIGLAGVLLLLPGYFTDLIGLVLLVPWTRALIYRLLARNLKVVEVTSTSYREVDPDVIELEHKDWRDGPDRPSL
jgi:UPF0716 protein FxsA